MCGIVGVFSTGSPVSSESLRKATQQLHHRGPDGQRQWIAPHGRVGMGHARLSIIDLTTGDQPISNEDESIRVVVNGELYDHERYQKQLEARGHRLRTRSDSEILVHLYEDMGVHCLRELRGEFAFVLWDERSGTLFAARDRFGIKPLFYARVGDTLYLASEVKALFAAGVPARWDYESVYQELHIVSDDDRTLFEGVRQIPPGHCLVATRDRFEVTRYWDLQFPTPAWPAPVRSEQEHVERMHELLQESIRLRLRADVPVGVYLSGGIDSSAILGMAAKMHPAALSAFTIAFDGKEYDESSFAEETAKRAGAEFHVFRMPDDLLGDHFADAVWHCETLAFNANFVAKHLLSAKVRELGFKVVLTGEGADEVLGGYDHFRKDMIAFGTPGQDEATTRARLESLQKAVLFPVRMPEQDAATEAVQRVLGYVPSWITWRYKLSLGIRPSLAAAFIKQFERDDPYQRYLNGIRLPYGSALDAMNQSMSLWIKSWLPKRQLVFLGDRVEMAHSIEGRPPFLDHVLVEAVSQMPADMKFRGEAEKYVLREAAKPYLTEALYKRHKHPFLAPLVLKGRMREVVFDTLGGRAAASAPFFDPAALRRLLDAPPAGIHPVTHDVNLLTLASLCILGQRFGL